MATSATAGLEGEAQREPAALMASLRLTPRPLSNPEITHTKVRETPALQDRASQVGFVRCWVFVGLQFHVLGESVRCWVFVKCQIFVELLCDELKCLVLGFSFVDVSGVGILLG